MLVDGGSGRRIGEGVANHFSQVVELVRRAESDARAFSVGRRSPPRRRRPGGHEALDGPERELDNDRELIRAGILPGDPSLYPSSLDGIYGPSGPAPRGSLVRDGTGRTPITKAG